MWNQDLLPAIDGMVTGEKETTGDGRMKMIVTYEDEAGASYSTEQGIFSFL